MLLLASAAKVPLTLHRDNAATGKKQNLSSRQRAAAATVPQRWQQRAAAAAAAASDGAAGSTEPQQAEGLLPEEDREIPGNYRDAMSGNTELGKAIRGACDELDSLGQLERQTLEEAEGLLKQLGFKGSLFKGQGQPPAADDGTH